MEISHEIIEAIVELYDRAREEHKTTKEKDYWQGRKDGLRLALAQLQPEESIWKMLNKSSYGFQSEEHVIVKKLMEDARYNIAAALYELQEDKRINIQTKVNLVQWIDWYDRLSKNGTTNPVTDACDSIPNFQWKIR